MTLEERIDGFSALGEKLNVLSHEELLALTDKVRHQNPWFTHHSIELSLTGIRKLLDPENLKRWVSSYNISGKDTDKVVALVLAGNIPLVGFHDVLCVLLSGHKTMVRMSSKDSVLLQAVMTWLTDAEPRFTERIQYAEQLKSFDAIIATGSDNTARYFDYYFGKYPHVIRKNRSSCAILTGEETPAELASLGDDVFSYFGMGCRNVSKLFIPAYYDIENLAGAWQKHKDVVNHHKYCNNYEYQKAVLIMNKQPFSDMGFVLLSESERLVSPISVVYFERYKDYRGVREKVNIVRDKIQCIVGNTEPATVHFGQAQYPAVWDYADGIDTMQFLNKPGFA